MGERVGFEPGLEGAAQQLARHIENEALAVIQSGRLGSVNLHFDGFPNQVHGYDQIEMAVNRRLQDIATRNSTAIKGKPNKGIQDIYEVELSKPRWDRFGNSWRVFITLRVVKK